MKKIILSAFLLFQVSTMANEVINVSGQKLVLIKIETAEKLLSVMNSRYQGVSKENQIKAIMESELELIPGNENYCSTAEKIYNTNGSAYQAFYNKCSKALVSQDLIEELATSDTGTHTVGSFRQAMSAYLAFLMLL